MHQGPDYVKYGGGLIICDLKADPHNPFYLQPFTNGVLFNFRFRANSRGTNSKELAYVISNLSAELLIYPSGYADNIKIYKAITITPTTYRFGEHGDEHALYLRCYASLTDIITIENNRKDLAPLFTFQLNGEISEFQVNPDGLSRVNPKNFESVVALKIGLDTWINQLRQTSILDYKLIQLPVSFEDISDVELRRFIDTSIALFYQGGSHGYDGCVINARKAMERSEIIFGIPDPKPEWTKQEATKLERLYANWHSVKKLTHLAAHKLSEFNRDEAQYVLTASISLMNSLIVAQKANLPK